jgi:hypothetical protein
MENPVTVDRLATGRAFHDMAQSAFLTDLTDATGFKERAGGLPRAAGDESTSRSSPTTVRKC